MSVYRMTFYNLAIHILLSCSFVIIGHATESTELSPRSYKVLEGDNLLVVCNATSKPETVIYWTKNDTKTHFLQYGASLTLINTSRNASGDYICHQVTSVPWKPERTENITVLVINVDVQYPSEIDVMYVAPQQLKENQLLTVRCKMQGNPNPVWEIGNKDTGRFIFHGDGPNDVSITTGVQCEDSGFWECTGRNKLNGPQNVTKGYQVTVFCSPRPIPGSQSYTITTQTGVAAMFVMNLWGFPYPNYIWSRDDGAPIGGYVQQFDYSNKTILKFNFVEVQHFGFYTLTMTNSYGTYQAKYELKADGRPETPRNLNFFDVSYDRVSLTWTSGYDMGSPQYFLILQLYGNNFKSISADIFDNSTNHGVNQNWNYLLTGLSSNTYYNLTVVANNQQHMSGFARPYVGFWTYERPVPPSVDMVDSSSFVVIVGITLGTLGSLATLAFVVYIIKYRRMRTSYATLK